MVTIGVLVALYRMLSELLESHTSRPHSNFPEPMAAGSVEASRLFFGGVASVVVLLPGSIRGFGLLSTRRRRGSAWIGGQLPAEALL